MPLTAFRRHPLLMPTIILLAGLLLFPAFTIVYTGLVQYRLQQNWCRLLDDITAGPAPPRVASLPPHHTQLQELSYHRWVVYEDLIRQKESFGCQ